MKFLFVTCLLLLGLYSMVTRAETEESGEKPEITKLDVVELGEGTDFDAEDSDVQRKRDSSGYSYRRPSFSLSSRGRFQSSHRGRIVNRHQAQINRPITKYGPPGYQNSPSVKPAGPHGQQHRDKLPFHGHFGQQHPSNGRPNGLLEQEVPSPIRHVDFVEPNPIASQNAEPFASHAANYLPPENQKLPEYSVPQSFSPAQVAPQANNQGQSENFVQSQGQISDAALFLSQNAQTIQQLYNAPPTDQDFAPNTDQFVGQDDQLLQNNGRLQVSDTGFQNSQGFAGPLPSYASGTLSPQETLEQIQSLEKDRLIVQLQQALASQAQAQNAGRYAQNQPSFVQNQDLLASLGQRMKIHGSNTQPSTVHFGPGNTAFNQSPFLPGTTISPGFPLNYGVSSTVQPPTATTTTTTTVQPPRGTKVDGTTQITSSTSAPPISTTAAGLPVYGGFVPTLIAGTNFVSNVPTYGPGFFLPVQPSGSSPTHFGIPIPTDQSQKPSARPPPSSTPSLTPSAPPTTKPSVPPSHPVHSVPLPVHPVVTPVHPVVTPVQPVHPVHPVQPTYGFQTPAINPVLYKPIKPVYPFYYYPNVAYQLHKPTVPAYPWSYAPTYAQTKPAQIWK